MSARAAIALALALSSCASMGADASPEPKVLLIGLDGVRPDCLVLASTPTIDALIAHGAVSYEAQTCARTVSGPSWCSLLTGTWPAKHRVVDNGFAGNRLDEHPPITALVEADWVGFRTMAVSQWDPLHEHVFATSACDHTRPATDGADVAAQAIELLRRDDPDLLFLHLDGGDHAGHTYGYGAHVPEYLAALEAIDAQLAPVLAAVRARPSYAREDWLVLVTTDHGGTGTGHGQDIPEHRTIFAIVSGDAAVLGKLEPPPGIVDLAATALAHLGVDVPERLDGRPVGLR